MLQTLVLLLILFAFTLRLAQVSGVSMEPTVPAGSFVVVGTFDYRFLPPKAGDVIAFWHERVGPETFIKRVIAVPGEQAGERDGVLQVNGRKADAGTVRLQDRRSVRSVTVPPHSYFVVGDNRPQSDDSRNWGTVERSSVMGRAYAVVWPLSAIRIIR